MSVNAPQQPLSILFDARMACHSGIGTYIRGLFEGFSQTPQPTPTFTLIGPPATWTPPSGLQLDTLTFDAPIYGLREQIAYPRPQNHVDLMHFPHYNVPMFLPALPWTVTIHDVIHLAVLQTLSPAKRAIAKAMLTRAANRARHIITVSEHSRNDIVKHLGISPEKITVIYEGIAHDFTPQTPDTVSDIRTRYNLPTRYFLAIGSDKPHKNLAYAVQAYQTWAETCPNKIAPDFPRLVIRGAQPDGPLQPLIERSSIKEFIRIMPFVEQTATLAGIVQNADAVIFPSSYEGFGLPAIEAQHIGTPLLCSNAAALPEVAGISGALFFAPDRPEQLAQLLHALTRMQDESLQNLIANGKQNAQRFSWTTTADKTRDVWQNILEKTESR